MKIMICGSMAFINDLKVYADKLNKMGHKAVIPYGTEPHVTDSGFVDSLDNNLDFCISNNVMKRNFDLVAENDAILVVNKKRNGIDGYIGVSVLMEMAIAKHLNKKMFILNPIPHHNKHRWAHEVGIMQPVVLNGDLNKIK